MFCKFVYDVYERDITNGYERGVPFTSAPFRLVLKPKSMFLYELNIGNKKVFTTN